MDAPEHDTTELLRRLQAGGSEVVDLLFPRVYDEIKAVAAAYMRRESTNHTLSATALVNEAYLRLIDQSRVEWQDRAHFCAMAAVLMRRVLVDHARRRLAKKRDARLRLTWDENMSPPDGRADLDLVSLDEALEDLASLNERHTRVVELRFFAGLSVKEAAAVLDCSPSTVRDDWRVARAWLLARLQDES